MATIFATNRATAVLTVDLGFGDAGKGTVVDYLTRAHQAHTVVRFNGGAQAGHRVVASQGEHVFSQFGSGTLAGAATHLSCFMLIEPLAMLAEADHLRALGVDALARTTIDERALVTTPYQRAVNRLRELARGAGRHGSCGMGIGETVQDALDLGAGALRAGDLRDLATCRTRLHALRQHNLAKAAPLRAHVSHLPAAEEELSLLDDDDVEPWLLEHYHTLLQQAQIVSDSYLASILREGTTVFEAAQGVLLDEWRGFHPYTTWSTTTLQNADTLLREAGYTGSQRRIGITRAYATRHGAGPFPTEDATLTAALPDARNRFHDWQQGFRVGWADAVLLRYARACTGPLDELAVTCLDRIAALESLQCCTAYRYDGNHTTALAPSTNPHDLAYQEGLTGQLAHSTPCYAPADTIDTLCALLGDAVGAPVTIRSYGPAATDKREG